MTRSVVLAVLTDMPYGAARVSRAVSRNCINSLERAMKTRSSAYSRSKSGSSAEWVCGMGPSWE